MMGVYEIVLRLIFMGYEGTGTKAMNLDRFDIAT